MKYASLKSELESAITNRFGPSVIGMRERPLPETFSTGISEIDQISGGIPRGAITEVMGPISSGRTSLLLSLLAEATNKQEVCALIDANDAFDPLSAAAAGVNLDRVLWIRCSGNAEHAIKAADLLLQGGGFGIVALDFGDVTSRVARRIPASYWFRFCRAIENTRTALFVITRYPCVRSCASLALEMKQEGVAWTTAGGKVPAKATPSSSYLLHGLRLRVERQRPVRLSTSKAWFEATASYHIDKPNPAPKKQPKT